MEDLSTRLTMHTKSPIRFKWISDTRCMETNDTGNTERQVRGCIGAD